MPLAAFPKCFLEDLTLERKMKVEDWIVMSDQFDIEGLEFYSGFAPLDARDNWEAFARSARTHGRSIPMLGHSPDFTHPDPGFRKGELARQRAAVEVAAQLGARYCRILTGQARPGLTVEQGIAWAKECIEESLAYAEKRQVTLNLEITTKPRVGSILSLPRSRRFFSRYYRFARIPLAWHQLRPIKCDNRW